MESFDPERERALMENARVSSEQAPADLFRTNIDGYDQRWLEAKMIPQTRIFYNDLLPALFAVCRVLWRGEPLSIADIGANSGAGAAQVSDSLNGITGFKVRVTGFDTDTLFAPYARGKFPQIEFVGGDFFNDPRRFDVVLCSHTLEHIPEPAEWVGRVLERANGAAMFYVPFEERNLIPGHVNRFTEAVVRSMPGVVWAQVRRTVGWRADGENSRCVAFVCLPEGSRGRAPEFKSKLQLETETQAIAL